MASIGDLILNIVANMKGFSTSVIREGEKAGTQAGVAAGKGFGKKLKESFSGSNLKQGLLGGLGLGAGLGAVSALSGGVSMLTEGIFKSIDAASNLNEAMTKSQAVFGDNADEIEKWAETASGAFGQSKRQALEAAGTFGNLIQAFGIGADKSAEMSKSLVELASDLASFNNTSVDEALEALRSGISGESEPLKRYGVAINEVRLKEEALRIGLIKTTKGVLPIAIKTQAAYSLILKDTALAQGDFANTADGLANTQKSLTADLEELSAAIGEALLPVMIELAQFVRDDIVPALRELITGLKDSEDAFNVLAEVFNAVVSQGRSGATAYAAHLKRELEKVNEANLETADMFVRAHEATREEIVDTGEAIETLTTQGQRHQREMGRSVTKAAESFEDYRDRVVSAAKDIVEKAYQVIADKAALNAANIEAAELRKVIATGKATDEQKARYRELTEEQSQLVLDLAANGVLAGKEVSDAMAALRKKLKTATGNERIAIQAAIAAVNELARAAERARLKIKTATDLLALGLGSSGLIGGNWGPVGRASGGHQAAGETGWVGERGPELWTPDTSGFVTDHATSVAAAASGSMGDTINVNLLDRMKVESARDIGAGLRMLGEQGHLGRRR